MDMSTNHGHIINNVLDRNSTELATLLEINHSVAEYQDLNDLVLYIINQVRSFIDADAISIILPVEKNKEFSFRWVDNLDQIQSTKLREIKFSCNLGIAGRVYKSGQPELILDVESDPRHFKEIDLILGFATKSMIAVPLYGKVKRIGVLEILNKKDGAFNVRDFNLITTTAAIIGIALENALIHADLQRTNIHLKESEEELKRHRDQLDKLVEERTVDLRNANEKLHAEIIERKRAEEVLRESEEKYRTAIEHSNDAVSIAKGGRHIFVNQRFLDIFGYEEPKEIIGKPLGKTIHPDDLEKVTDIALRRQKGESVPSRYEAKCIRKDGETIYIEASVARTTYRGEIVSLAYLRDITRRKRAQQEKIQLGKLGALGTLIAGIAHEMNNPMMGMLNFIQYCLKNTSKSDKLYTVLEDTERETKRCIDIVQNLLTFSRIEKADEEKYRKESLKSIFDRVFKLLSYRIEKENIVLTQKYSEETPEIWLKTSNMQQVFLNLIDNTLDALKGRKKKEIHVKIRPEGKFVLVTITDSGCGISPENLQKAFDPFFTTKPPGKGTGLGLSVCHSIVKAHGGKITCESEVGVGTKFKMLFPIDRRA